MSVCGLRFDVVAISGQMVTAPAQVLTVAALQARGYDEVLCTFKKRCVINLPCETARRDHWWFLRDDEGLAYRVFQYGRVSRKGQSMPDQRWKHTSQARAVLLPMRKAVASHLKVFGGGAICSLQSAANPGLGQFLPGQCAKLASGDGNVSRSQQPVAPSQ